MIVLANDEAEYWLVRFRTLIGSPLVSNIILMIIPHHPDKLRIDLNETADT